MNTSRSLVLRTVAWCVGVLLVGAGLLTAVVLGAGALVGPPEAQAGREQADAAATAGEFARLAADDPAAALRSCTAARSTDFDALAGALSAGAVAEGERYAVSDGDLVFLSAPVAGDDLAERAGDRAVWAYGRQGYAAVTDDARALTPDLPGPRIYGVEAGAPGVDRVATCVEAAQRVAASDGSAQPGR